MLNQVQHDIFSLRHPELTLSSRTLRFFVRTCYKESFGISLKKTPQGDKKIKPWGVPVFTKTRSII
jgi:hypothetical protein